MTTRDGDAAHRREINQRSVEALRALQRSLGLDPDRDPPTAMFDVRPPIVRVMCRRGHRLAGIWRTPEGPLFLSYPSVSTSEEVRTGRFIVRLPGDYQVDLRSRCVPVELAEPAGSRRVIVADLLEFMPDEQAHPPLRASCRCGNQVVDRPRARAEYKAAAKTRARTLVTE